MKASAESTLVAVVLIMEKIVASIVDQINWQIHLFRRLLRKLEPSSK
jgi:hypothetical protein